MKILEHLMTFRSSISTGKPVVFDVFFFRFPEVERMVCVSVKSKLQHAPPPRAYPGHLTPLPSRGGGNLIISLPGGGEFDPHALGVGNLNYTLHFM